MPADTLLFAGRMMTILLTLALGLTLALWTRKQFNAPAAILALLFFCFDSKLIAHGRYVTSDLFVTLFSFLACISWGRSSSAGGNCLCSGWGSPWVWPSPASSPLFSSFPSMCSCTWFAGGSREGASD
jgi:4-amino-4-deoxy-L-arabinose transferase-like glycosyltransferase